MTYAKPLENNCLNQTKTQKAKPKNAYATEIDLKKCFFHLAFGFLHYMEICDHQKPQAKTQIAKTPKLPTRNFAMRQQQFT
jgi:hypothetical protein